MTETGSDRASLLHPLVQLAAAIAALIFAHGWAVWLALMLLGWAGNDLLTELGARIAEQRRATADPSD